VKVQDQMQLEAGDEIGEKDKPLAGVEDFVRRIRRHRLAGLIEPVPQRQLAGQDEIANDLFDGEEVQRNIAIDDRLPEKQQVAECCGDDDGEDEER